MTPRNQMYSVLTRELANGQLSENIRVGLIAITFLFPAQWWVMSAFANKPDHEAISANALTYEDGLALANSYRGLLKEAKEPHPWVLKLSEGERKRWTALLAKAMDDAERDLK